MMVKNQTEKLSAQLQKRHDQIMARLKSSLAGLTNSSGDCVDVAFDAIENDLSSALAQREAKELAKINRTLELVKAGKYGVCEWCEKKIPAARLKALPDTTVCIGCQKLQESGDFSKQPKTKWGDGGHHNNDDDDNQQSVQIVSE